MSTPVKEGSCHRQEETEEETCDEALAERVTHGQVELTDTLPGVPGDCIVEDLEDEHAE